MKGKFLSVLLYPALLLALTSCGVPNRGPAETDSPKVAESTEAHAAITETATTDTEAAETHAADTEATETNAAITETAQPATLSIGYADDALLSQPDACERFSVSDSEWAVNAVLSTDVPVRDFKVLAIAMKEIGEDGVMSFDLSEELYSLEELSPEKPLVLSTEFAGMVPTIGISYRDTDGTERFYALSMSGENSDLLLLDANI